MPSDIPNEIHPHTLHSRHRQYDDPADLERFVTFPELQRIRYTTDEGICIHDQYVLVRYEFTSVSSSISFQGDLRRRDLVDFYDVDVVWTNIHGRTDSFGKVKGIGAIQRLKMWRDRYTTFHSISVLANKTDGMYREYDVHLFEGELRQREDRTKQIRLNVVGRRGSMPEETPQRRFSFHHRRRPRLRSADQSGQMGSDASPSHPPIDMRYLAIQFTHRQGKFPSSPNTDPLNLALQALIIDQAIGSFSMIGHMHITRTAISKVFRSLPTTLSLNLLRFNLCPRHQLQGRLLWRATPTSRARLAQSPRQVLTQTMPDDLRAASKASEWRPAAPV